MAGRAARETVTERDKDMGEMSKFDVVLKQGFFYDVNGLKCHIVLKNDEVIVWKFWSTKSQAWRYEAESFENFSFICNHIGDYFPERVKK